MVDLYLCILVVYIFNTNVKHEFTTGYYNWHPVSSSWPRLKKSPVLTGILTVLWISSLRAGWEWSPLTSPVMRCDTAMHFFKQTPQHRVVLPLGWIVLIMSVLAIYQSGPTTTSHTRFQHQTQFTQISYLI